MFSYDATSHEINRARGNTKLKKNEEKGAVATEGHRLTERWPQRRRNWQRSPLFLTPIFLWSLRKKEYVRADSVIGQTHDSRPFPTCSFLPWFGISISHARETQTDTTKQESSASAVHSRKSFESSKSNNDQSSVA